MPYIRLFSRKVSPEEKHVLAEKLMSVALSAFELRPEERHRITIQFMLRNECPERFGKKATVLEVADHELTVRKITAFVEAATPVLNESRIVGPGVRIIRMLGMKADAWRQIAFQFTDTGYTANKTAALGAEPRVAQKAA